MWNTLLYCPLFTGFLCSMWVTGLNVLRRASQFLHLDLAINYLLSVFKQHNCFNPLPVRPWFFLQHTTLRASWRLYPEHVPCSLQLKKKTLGHFSPQTSTVQTLPLTLCIWYFYWLLKTCVLVILVEWAALWLLWSSPSVLLDLLLFS